MTPDIEKKLIELGRALRSDESIVKNVMTRLEDETILPQRPAHNVWRIIMMSRIAKFAAAAVIMITVGLLVYWHTGSIDGATVAWAEVFRNVEASDTVVCRAHVIDSNTSGSLEIEYHATTYFSSKFGTWQDDFNDV